MAVGRTVSKKKNILVVLIAVIVVATLALLLPRTFHKKIQKTTLKESPNKPEEVDPVKAGYIWQGSAEDPKKLVISKIRVDSYVQNVGIDNNQIVAPSNIYIAGWYVNSARPGKKGLSIIDGHLNGFKHDGIFINLDKLRPGDELSIEMGNGSKYNYKVIGNDTVDEKKASAYLFNQSPKVIKQLNLITCGGNYDKNNRYYDKRVIVSAEQIN